MQSATIPAIETRIDELLQYMLQRHAKVFIVRLDLRWPTPSTEAAINRIFSSFIARLAAQYYEIAETKFIWCRETSPTSGRPHWHVILLFDGQKVCQGWSIYLNALSRWQHLTGSSEPWLVHLCDWTVETSWGAGGVMLLRSDPASRYQDICQILRYIAKTYSKGLLSPRMREFGSSRLYLQ